MTNETTNTARKGLMALAVAVAVVALSVALVARISVREKRAMPKSVTLMVPS